MNNKIHIIIPIVGLVLVMGISALIPLLSRDKGVAIEVSLEEIAETDPLPDAASSELALQSDPIPIETVQQVQDTFIGQQNISDSFLLRQLRMTGKSKPMQLM